MQNFLAHTDETRQKMLEEIGIASIEDLFASIPSKAQTLFDLNEGISEMKAQKELKALSQKNNTDFLCFLGGGVYKRFIPAAVSEIARRFEFNTAYTPYQPEISQGTLQAIYEFQSMICELTGMDVSNASVYDGATACAEALAMAVKIKKKKHVLISSILNPEYKKVVETYAHNAGIKIDYASEKDGKTILPEDMSSYAAVLVQMPNYYGVLEDVEELSSKKDGALFIVCADIMSLSILKPPSEYEADIVVGDFQQLGLPMNNGGPHGGFMASKSVYARQLPGRIVGMSIDKNNKRAFTLTLQAREQHIRREKATSNICTNNSLNALCATVYMSLLANAGMREVEVASIKRAHDLAEKLSQINGVEICYSDFLNEFVIKTSRNAKEILDALRKAGILGGIEISEDKILIATTEIIEPEDVDFYASEMKKLFKEEL